jgi:hypothetical protein
MGSSCLGDRLSRTSLFDVVGTEPGGGRPGGELPDFPPAQSDAWEEQEAIKEVMVFLAGESQALGQLAI